MGLHGLLQGYRYFLCTESFAAVSFSDPLQWPQLSSNCSGINILFIRLLYDIESTAGVVERQMRDGMMNINKMQRGMRS
jgi:hypothetical protein